MAEDSIESRNVGGALSSMGISEFIANLAKGIAQGQLELDQACMKIAAYMGEAEIAFGKRADADEPDRLSLVELGFTPNFYQFSETSVEVKVAISTRFQQTNEEASQERTASEDKSSTSSTSQNRSDFEYAGSGYQADSFFTGETGRSDRSTELAITSVDANYASTYNYSAETASIIKTKITPVPPPSVFEDILREKLEQKRQAQARRRLLIQARLLVETVHATAGAALAEKAGLGTTSTAERSTDGVRSAQIAAIEKALADIIAAHERLTTEHWAVIDHLDARAAADEKLDLAVAELEALRRSDVDKDSVGRSFKAIRTAVKQALAEFTDRYFELRALLDGKLAATE